MLSLSFGWLTLNRWEGVLESLIPDKEKRTFSSLIFAELGLIEDKEIFECCHEN